MSKLAFFAMTLVGAIPAGGALYALIRNILDRANDIGTVLLIVTIVASVCTALVVLTPFIVLVFYKDTRLPMAPAPEGAAAAAPKKADEEDGFGDAIPDDFDEEELAASAGDDDEFDDDVDAFDDDDYGDYDEEYEEFDEDEEF